MSRDNFDGPIWVFLVIWFLAAVLSLAWLGTLIWAVIYIVTHIGEWVG